MMNSVLLKDLVRISSGVFLSKTSNTDSERLTNTTVHMLMTADFDEQGVIRRDLEPNALYKDSLEKNFLQQGDILFNAKGRRFFATVYQNEYPQAIASTTFLVLRVMDNSKVTPNYLAWFLNHSTTQVNFQAKHTTQNIPMVTKGELMELEIIVPPLQKQAVIADLDHSLKRFQQIQLRLIELKKQEIEALTYRSIE